MVSQSSLHSDSYAPILKNEFISAVQNFKREHQIKLKELFGVSEDKSERISRIFELRAAFLNNDTIRRYLGRSFDQIPFTEYHPKFIVDKASKLTNDYYEVRIYSFQWMKPSFSPLLPYRNDVMSIDFYTTGFCCNVHQLSSLIQPKSQEIKVIPKADIYEIRSWIGSYQVLGFEKIRFMLLPNHKDNHATSIIAILEKHTDRVLAAIFINSWKKNEYTDYIKCRFKLQAIHGGMRFHSSSQKAFGLYEKITKDLECSKDPLDRDNRIGYILEPKLVSGDPEEVRIEDAFNKKEIHLIYRISKRERRGIPYIAFRVSDNRPIPFIDASHSLQTAYEDGNCALYSINFLQAVCNLLEDPESADRVYDLTLKLNDGDRSEKEQAHHSLIKVFQEEIKSYLPFYYHDDGTSKDEAALKQFHLQQRWEIGNQILNDPNYLCKIGFLNNESPSTLESDPIII